MLKIKDGVNMNKKENILQDSYYLINKFIHNNKKITYPQLQKLMFFFELYYMNIKNSDKLYDEYFYTWITGASSLSIYKKFAKFGSNTIELSKQEKRKGSMIPLEKKKLLDNIYKTFKNMNPIDLMKLFYMKNSPCFETLKKNRTHIKNEIQIDKIKSKKWFRKIFMKEVNDG